MRPGGRYVEIGNISPGLTYQADRPSGWSTTSASCNNHYGKRHLRDALSILRRTRARPVRADRLAPLPLAQVNERAGRAEPGPHHPRQSGLVAGLNLGPARP